MLINISSHTHSTKHLQWLVSFQSVIISQGPFTPLKNRIMCLIRRHALTASIPTLTIVVIQSSLSYCQVFSSAYIIYILFLPIFSQGFSAFVYSLLSGDLWWLLIDYSFLYALFLIWLFLCLVVLRVSVFYIANWLLFVWMTCVRNHTLAARNINISNI